MGSTGAFLESGGFKVQDWEEDGKMFGIKILKKKTTGKERQSLPPLSNTPGTAYILLNPDGGFKQFRQFREDHRPLFDVDFGIHNGKLSLHIHYKRNKGSEPEIIASKEDGIVNKKLYNKFKKFLKGVDL